MLDVRQARHLQRDVEGAPARHRSVQRHDHVGQKISAATLLQAITLNVTRSAGTPSRPSARAENRRALNGHDQLHRHFLVLCAEQPDRAALGVEISVARAQRPQVAVPKLCHRAVGHDAVGRVQGEDAGVVVQPGERRGVCHGLFAARVCADVGRGRVRTAAEQHAQQADHDPHRQAAGPQSLDHAPILGTPAFDESASHAGYAFSAGGGASVRLAGQFWADVDAKYFRLSRDRNIMRLGGGVSVRF